MNISKILDARIRLTKGQRGGNYRNGMDPQERMKKENKTLGTRRSENIHTL